MFINDVIKEVQKYHPAISDYDRNPVACDGVKYGNVYQECTGIAVAIGADVSVIRKAGEMGCNFLFVHEPTFYTHMDSTKWLTEDKVYVQKIELLDLYHMVIYRDHDHLHAHQPDGIFYGVMKELGWEEYLEGDSYLPMIFQLPTMTVRQLALYIKEKLGLETLRMVGNENGEISRVMFYPHIFDDTDERQKDVTKSVIEHKIDVIIPLECIDWTILSYMKDAGAFGMNKALLQPGHLNVEELGMKWAVHWLRGLLGNDIPVTFVKSGDTYHYL